MFGALLVLVGMTLVLWGGIELIIEETAPPYSAIQTQTAEETNLSLPIGIALTLAGGVVLLLSPSPRFA
jgi:hypothetical protein